MLEQHRKFSVWIRLCENTVLFCAQSFKDGFTFEKRKEKNGRIIIIFPRLDSTSSWNYYFLFFPVLFLSGGPFFVAQAPVINALCRKRLATRRMAKIVKCCRQKLRIHLKFYGEKSLVVCSVQFGSVVVIIFENFKFFGKLPKNIHDDKMHKHYSLRETKHKRNRLISLFKCRICRH